MKNCEQWVRVAGDSANIKARNPNAWRCYFEGNSKEVLIKSWSVSGTANEKNVIPGFSADRDKNGLLAWIDFFGIATIKNGILYIEL